MRLVLLLLAVLTTGLLNAQTVREESSLGSNTKFLRKAAEEAGVYWPKFADGDKGTQIQVSFDARDSDICVVTEKSFGEAKLLQTLQALANELNLPKADFIVFPSRSAVVVDIELNDYLQHPADMKTAFTLQLGKAIHFLERAGLPKPLVIAIDGSDSDKMILQRSGQASSSINDIQFFTPQQIAEDATLDSEVTLTRLGYIVIVAGLAILVLPFFFSFRVLRRIHNPGEVPESSPPKSPEEIQREYDKRKPFGLISLFPLLLMLFLFGGSQITIVKVAARSAVYLLPNGFDKWLMVGPPLLIFVFFPLIFFLIRRKSGKKQQERTLEPHQRILGSMWPMFISAILLFSLMALIRLWPGFVRLNISTTAVKVFIWSSVGLGIGTSVILAFRASRSYRRDLKPGDPWYDKTIGLAERVGVKIRNVRLVKDPAVNAFADVLNNVGLTEGLLEKLSPDEVEAVIAHELGHHKVNDPRRTLLLSLLFLLSYLLFVSLPLRWASETYHWSILTRAFINSPVIIIFILPFIQSLIFGKVRRRNEHRADAFAAKIMGDKELVIRALTKMTHLNESPERLKPMDEFLSSHPSLQNRIESLRQLDMNTFDPRTYR